MPDPALPRASAAASPAEASAPRVWVVDDSASEARFITTALGTGFQVETFPDGAAMLERLDSGRAPDVVVLDWDPIHRQLPQHDHLGNPQQGRSGGGRHWLDFSSSLKRRNSW